MASLATQLDTKRKQMLYQKYVESLKGANPSEDSLIAWDKANGRELLDWDQTRNVERGLRLQARSLITSFNVELTAEKDSEGKRAAVRLRTIVDGTHVPVEQRMEAVEHRLNLLMEHTAMRLKHYGMKRGAVRKKMMTAVEAGIKQAYKRT